jgi:CSLREA domain-containing protein
MRRQQLQSGCRREAAGPVRCALAAARAWLEHLPWDRSSLTAIVLLVGLAATSRAAFAASDTVTVNTLKDEDTPGDGTCSLREAIANINTQ